MSESISTPVTADVAAPAAAPATTSAPPPALSEPLSLSEAGRLLARRRVEAAQGTPQARAPAPEGAPAEGAARAAPSSYDVLAKALGLPEAGNGEAAPEGAPANGAQAPQGMAGIELDGQHYTHDTLRSALRLSADYTQKTQALAEQQRSMQGQLEALATVLPYIKPELDALQGRLREAQMPDPALIESNPQEFLRQQAAWQRTLADQQRLGQIEQLNNQATARMRAQQVAQGNQALAEKYPFWRDEGQRSQIQKDIKEWATKKAGFSEQELAGLADHRQVEVMMRAMMFDRMTDGARSNTTAPRTNGAAPARGMAPPPAPSESVARAESRFGDAPNIRNATALLSARRATERFNNR